MTSVRHSSQVTQRGFTMIPNTIMLRGDLTPAAKLVYGYLKHLAWRSGGGEDADPDPPRAVIAEDLNMSEKSVTSCVRELQRAPVLEGADDHPTMLVVAVRRGQGRTNSYVLNDPEEAENDVPESGRSRKAETAVLKGNDPPFPARERGTGEEQEQDVETNNLVGLTPDDPPPVVKVDGRDLPFDALAEVCEIREGSPRLVQVALALNGPKGQPKLGLRRIYWGELIRRAGDVERRVEHLHTMIEDPAIFADYLARAITRRGQLFRENMPGITFGPQKLRDWFLDLEPTGSAPDDDTSSGFNWGDA